jgi:hypothetical protein
VIRARRRRIVAVVGGDCQEIGIAQRIEHGGQPFIESLDVRGVACDVVAMTVKRVEVDQIREDQA